MKGKESFSVPVVGASSLLTIFSVLCLAVFALLSVSTAQAQKRLADASVEAVSAYYLADSQAEEIFARLRAGETAEGVRQEDGIYTYSCPVSENQSLEVTLRQEETGWTVLRWQTVSQMDGQTQENLEVWDGEVP